MKKIWLLLLSGFLVAGCATFPVEGWKKPSTVSTDEQMMKDILECENTATTAVGPQPFVGGFHWFADRNNAFEMCMKIKGYVR